MQVDAFVFKISPSSCFYHSFFESPPRRQIFVTYSIVRLAPVLILLGLVECTCQEALLVVLTSRDKKFDSGHLTNVDTDPKNDS